MKKIYTLLAAVLMNVSLFAASEKVPTSVALQDAGYNYTIILFDPECTSNEFEPVIFGDFDSWNGTPMSKTVYMGDSAYMYILTDKANHKINFRDALAKDGSNQLQYKDSYGNWKDLPDFVLPPVVTGTDTTIVFDYYNPARYRYPLCDFMILDVYMTAYLPAGAPEAGVELMGTYRGGTWSGDGLLMSLDSASGAYKATFKATEMSEFQFRELGNWYNKLQMTEDGGETWDYSYNFKVGEEIERDGDRYVMNLYLSDPTEFRWSQGYKQETDKTIIYAQFPTLNMPANVQLEGTFEAETWGMSMYNQDMNIYVTNDDLTTTDNDEFKFKGTDNNAIVLCQYISADGDQEGRWEQAVFQCNNYTVERVDGELIRLFKLKINDPDTYAWMQNVPEPQPEGIEHIVLTEKVRKVVIDGTIYIVRDNKLFNLQGAQVR